MKKMVVTCDHCGKELDNIKDYSDVELDTIDDFFKTDLCSECCMEISRIIKKFCGVIKD